MTSQDVKDRLREIRRHVDDGDDERAHVAEDNLRRDVLRAIANGSSGNTFETSELAKLALSSQRYNIARHCA